MRTRSVENRKGIRLMNKRIISAAAALIMALGTGCAAKTDKDQKTSEVLKGGYVEENAFSFNYTGTGNNGISDIPLAGELTVQNGKVCFADQLNLRFYTETDDLKSFNKEQNDTMLTGEISTVLRSSEGKIFAIHYEMDQKSHESRNDEGVFIGTDGTLTKIECQYELPFQNSSYEFGSDGMLYFISDSKLISADPDTGKTRILCDVDGENIDAVGKYIVISSPFSNEVIIYDTESEETLDKQTALDEFWSKNILTSGRIDYDICEGEDGTLYIACGNGIFRYAFGGNKVEQICTGAGKRLSSIGDVNNLSYISSIVKESENTILIGYMDGIIMRYRYDPEFEETISNELKIYSFEYNQLAAKAINWYTKQHPDILVKQELPDPTLTYDDKVKNLVTEIMSDDPPDVIFLDGLDINNLSEKDVLADLSENHSEWYPENDELLDNIVMWNQNEDGKLYSVAGGFAVPYFISNGTEDISDIESYKDYADLVIKRKNDEKEPMNYIPALMDEDTAWKAYLLDGQKLIDGDSPDREGFKALIESCRQITLNDERIKEKYPDLSEDSWIHVTVAGLDMSSDEKRIDGRFLYNSAGISLLTGASPVSAGFVFNYQYDFETITSVLAKFKDAQLKFSSSFMPTSNMGICSRSDNREEAAEFIRSALSYLPQTGLSADGIPVNTHALRDDLATDKSYGQPSLLGMGGRSTSVNGDSIWFDYTYPTDDQLNDFIEMAKGLKDPITYDRQTLDMVTETITKYFKNDITSDEAAEAIMSRKSLKSKE